MNFVIHWNEMSLGYPGSILGQGIKILFLTTICSCLTEVSTRGLNPYLLNWQHGVLTTGPPGKSLEVIISSATRSLNTNGSGWKLEPKIQREPEEEPRQEVCRGERKTNFEAFSFIHSVAALSAVPMTLGLITLTAFRGNEVLNVAMVSAFPSAAGLAGHVAVTRYSWEYRFWIQMHLGWNPNFLCLRLLVWFW